MTAPFLFRFVLSVTLERTFQMRWLKTAVLVVIVLPAIVYTVRKLLTYSDAFDSNSTKKSRARCEFSIKCNCNASHLSNNKFFDTREECDESSGLKVIAYSLFESLDRKDTYFSLLQENAMIVGKYLPGKETTISKDP